MPGFVQIPNKSRSTTAPTNATATGSVQVLAAANPNRVYIRIQNTSDTAMWVNFGAADAAANVGFSIAAGATWESSPVFCPVSRVSVLGTNTKTYAHLIY